MTRRSDNAIMFVATETESGQFAVDLGFMPGPDRETSTTHGHSTDSSAATGSRARYSGHRATVVVIVGGTAALATGLAGTSDRCSSRRSGPARYTTPGAQ